MKIFMDKHSGEIALSDSPRRLLFEDGSTGDWCNQFIFVGYL